MRIDDLTIDAHPLRPHTAELLASWQWLGLPQGAVVVAVTRMGDLFLQQPTGPVYWLDTHRGACTQVAATGREFITNLAAHTDDWLRAPDTVRAQAAGLALGPRQVYSFEVPLALGGSTGPDNLKPCNVFLHVGIQGQILQQVAVLPPGTRIDRVVVKGPKPKPKPKARPKPKPKARPKPKPKARPKPKPRARPKPQPPR